MLHPSEILKARHRLTGYLRPSSLEAAPGLGKSVWLKLENTNRSRSFKIRGALNALLALPPEARAKGIVTASSGNHAQAVAYAAHVLGASAKILMPEHTPRKKIEGSRRYGAQVVLHGSNFDETEAEGRRLEKTESLTFVSPYNDPQVVAGAGTIGLELLDELPGIRRVIVPVSGAGLISGIGLALKNSNPNIEVIGAASISTPALYNFIHEAEYPQVWDTLAEALSGEIEAGSITFEISRKVVDRVVLVTEEAIAEAIRWSVFQAGWVIEGGAAVGLAAVLSGVLTLDEQPTVIVLSGANIDEEALRRVLMG